MRIGMKTLKVVIEKVRTAPHWFLPVFSLEHFQQCSVYDPAKIFFASKFSYVLFCNPTHKTETGTANRCRTTNSKPPRPINMMGQSETLSSSQIILLHSFLQAPLTSHGRQCDQLCGAKTNFLSQTGGIRCVFLIQFYCPGSHTWRCSYFLLTLFYSNIK